ncbi:hypothetical protein [Kitasatospora phosalacinea]|uniref:hypothetical protein n=1 Tax=Kitasatospora phosalacinea TaxID=2065 RepID=UPI00131EC6E1|nr:hypothetical protein [Kitasatospora phosalacinea]
MLVDTLDVDAALERLRADGFDLRDQDIARFSCSSGTASTCSAGKASCCLGCPAACGHCGTRAGPGSSEHGRRRAVVGAGSE